MLWKVCLKQHRHLFEEGVLQYMYFCQYNDNMHFYLKLHSHVIERHGYMWFNTVYWTCAYNVQIRVSNFSLEVILIQTCRENIIKPCKIQQVISMGLSFHGFCIITFFMDSTFVEQTISIIMRVLIKSGCGWKLACDKFCGLRKKRYSILINKIFSDRYLYVSMYIRNGTPLLLLPCNTFSYSPVL